MSACAAGRRHASSRWAVAAGAILLASLAAPAWAGNHDIETWHVQRPGVVLVDPTKRAAELEVIDPSERTRLCPAMIGGEGWDPAKAQPVIHLAGSADPAVDPASSPFALAVMAGAGAALAGDRAAGQAAMALVERWADADALSDLADTGSDRTNLGTQTALRRILLAVIPAWAVLVERAQVPPDARARVDAWIARRVADADQPTGPAATRDAAAGPSNQDHHRVLREAVVMAGAIYRGDDAGFRRGARFFRAVLHQMRPDGSLPLETSRGAGALSGQRQAVAGLVLMADMARAQGYDLFGLDVEGRRIERLVGFLTSAIADPDALQPYTGDRQDLDFLQPHDGRHAMAWVESWNRSRAADPVATGDVLTTVLAYRPLIDEGSGGNLTCLRAKLD